MVIAKERVSERLDEPAPEREVGAEVWPEGDFERIFRQHYGRVVGVLFKLTGDRARAEELAGDVFWKAYQQPLPAAREHNIGGWLYRIATRLGIDWLRASARRKRYEQEAGLAALDAGELDSQSDPLTDVLRDEKRRRVRAALSQIRPAQAQLLILRQGGLSYQELAAALGVKASSVGTLLARAEAEFEKRFRELHGQFE